jgi:hypothetical protein
MITKFNISYSKFIDIVTQWASSVEVQNELKSMIIKDKKQKLSFAINTNHNVGYGYYAIDGKLSKINNMNKINLVLRQKDGVLFLLSAFTSNN